MLYQRIIPDNLSERRYISGIYALNLPAPEDTSGDWHFINVFYDHSLTSERVLIAGEGEKLNSNRIWGGYGVYLADAGLAIRGLKADGKNSYAANHFRAILDLVYESLEDGEYPSYWSGASEDFLDTVEEKNILLEKAKMMFPFLSVNQSVMLEQWIDKESKPGYRA